MTTNDDSPHTTASSTCGERATDRSGHANGIASTPCETGNLPVTGRGSNGEADQRARGSVAEVKLRRASSANKL